MNDDELCQKVLGQYKRTYPGWTNERVTEIVRNVFFGNLAVVRATDSNGQQMEEICYVSTEGKITIFSTTEELAHFLEAKFNRPWYWMVLTKDGVSTIITGLLTIALLIIVFKHEVNKDALQIIGTAYGSLIGYYFGRSQSR